MTIHPGDIEIYNSSKEKWGNIENHRREAGQCMNYKEMKMSVWQKKMEEGEPRERK